MTKMKIFIKFIVIVGILISGIQYTSINASSNEDTLKISPRLTLTAYGDTRSMGGGVQITPFIQYDLTTGKIQNYNVKAMNLGSKVYRYVSSYTNNRTAVNFTVTIYSTNVFGDLDKALETQYWTVRSPGPKTADIKESRSNDDYRKQ